MRKHAKPGGRAVPASSHVPLGRLSTGTAVGCAPPGCLRCWRFPQTSCGQATFDASGQQVPSRTPLRSLHRWTAVTNDTSHGVGVSGHHQQHRSSHILWTPATLPGVLVRLSLASPSSVRQWCHQQSRSRSCVPSRSVCGGGARLVIRIVISRCDKMGRTSTYSRHSCISLCIWDLYLHHPTRFVQTVRKVPKADRFQHNATHRSKALSNSASRSLSTATLRA